jgi:4-hydroxy-2-oxoglutarate aldolase
VADASPLPLLLYNVPKFTHVQIPTVTVVSLARHERIVGIKDSSGDLERIAELRSTLAADFAVICGDHDIFPEALSRGVRAGILAAADPFPSAWVRIHRAARAGEAGAAERIHRRVTAASGLAVSRLGVAGIKAAMDLCGLYGGPPRPPLLPVDEEGRCRLEREVDELRRAGLAGAAP